jgi:predicted N-formylglutamate amidohydrolase
VVLSPLITCEHAGNFIPPGYSRLFEGQSEVLRSHRGWDPGAVDIAEYLSGKLNAPLFKCHATRLLVETNRSLWSSNLFSEYSAGLTVAEREEVLRQFYYPHRSGVEEWIRNSAETVLHLSIHSFTPVFGGVTRNVDVGLLFDPARQNESTFCETYRKRLEAILPGHSIEFNEPYKGIDDGFTTYLRQQFGNDRYLGIEIEVNQKYTGEAHVAICSGLHLALVNTLAHLGDSGVTV